MAKKRNDQQTGSRLDYKKEKVSLDKTLGRPLSNNETPVSLLDPELKVWIKVIRPSRASLTYERME